jgi:hypothetical protein
MSYKRLTITNCFDCPYLQRSHRLSVDNTYVGDRCINNHTVIIDSVSGSIPDNCLLSDDVDHT